MRSIGASHVDRSLILDKRGPEQKDVTVIGICAYTGEVDHIAIWIAVSMGKRQSVKLAPSKIELAVGIPKETVICVVDIHPKCRCDQRAHVDRGVLAEDDAVRVDEEDPAVGLQRPKDLAWIVAEHPVEQNGAVVRLLDDDTVFGPD